VGDAHSTADGAAATPNPLRPDGHDTGHGGVGTNSAGLQYLDTHLQWYVDPEPAERTPVPRAGHLLPNHLLQRSGWLLSLHRWSVLWVRKHERSKTVMACCPKAHKCVFSSPYNPWEASSHPQTATCVPDGLGITARTDASQLPNTTGIYPCKPGAALPSRPLPGKNVLVIGDSVSLGWTPPLAELLKEEALVQHSPGGGDGGAEETAYGLQCLDYFLRSPNGTMNVPDVLIFNWGLHDGPYLGPFPWTGPGTYHWSGPGNMTIPGQEGPEWLYSSQLSQITEQLVAWVAAHNNHTKLLFALTSPMVCNETSDGDVAWLNVQAATIMARLGVQVVDLHAPIIRMCGAAPQPTCFGLGNGFCPHCIGGNQTEDGIHFAPPNVTFGGYAWLARTTIAPAVRDLLA
jgi:hypothetical protein